jgi:entericidin A
MKAIWLMCTVIFVAALFGGCNTMRGLGQDVEKVGDKIEKKAEEKKNY